MEKEESGIRVIGAVKALAVSLGLIFGMFCYCCVISESLTWRIIISLVFGGAIALLVVLSAINFEKGIEL